MNLERKTYLRNILSSIHQHNTTQPELSPSYDTAPWHLWKKVAIPNPCYIYRFNLKYDALYSILSSNPTELNKIMRETHQDSLDSYSEKDLHKFIAPQSALLYSGIHDLLKDWFVEKGISITGNGKRDGLIISFAIKEQFHDTFLKFVKPLTSRQGLFPPCAADGCTRSSRGTTYCSATCLNQ
jgi:hypothetical protein